MKTKKVVEVETIYVDFANHEYDAVVMWDKLEEAMRDVPPGTKVSFRVYDYRETIQVVKDQHIRIV